MLKITYILIGIILLLIIVGIIYRTGEISSTKSPDLRPSISTTPSSIDYNQIENIRQALDNLISEKKSQKCALNNTIQNISITGTIYTENGKIRTDFTSKSLPLNITGHIIMDPQNVYLWTDASNKGVQILIADTQAAITISPQQPSPEITKKLPFLCEPWSPDPAFFTLPSNITFQIIPDDTMPANLTSTISQPSISITPQSRNQ